jgi:DNA-binding XRE family transcriptional regulator
LNQEEIEPPPGREVRVGTRGSHRYSGRSEDETGGHDLLQETQSRQVGPAELLGNGGISEAEEQRAAGFGQRLRALRRAGGYSMAELAAKLGVTWQAIQIWEKGASLPRPDLWGTIAVVLGTTVP